MAKRKQRTIADVGSEPEELRLWRQIIAYRDLLVRRALDWERFLERQQGGLAPLESLPDNARQTAQAARDRSESLTRQAIANARADIVDFDPKVGRLRANKGGVYGLAKLRRFVSALSTDVTEEALAAVRAFIHCPGKDDEGRVKETKLFAQAWLVCCRDSAPGAADVGAAMNRILGEGSDIDIDDLLANARKERFAQNDSGASIARRVVSQVIGVQTHSRRLRRS